MEPSSTRKSTGIRIVKIIAPRSRMNPRNIARDRLRSACALIGAPAAAWLRASSSCAVLAPGELQEDILQGAAADLQAGQRAAAGQPAECPGRVAGDDAQRHAVVGHLVAGQR